MGTLSEAPIDQRGNGWWMTRNVSELSPIEKVVYPLPLISMLPGSASRSGTRTTVGRSTDGSACHSSPSSPAKRRNSHSSSGRVLLEKKHYKIKSFSVGVLAHLMVLGLIMVLCLAQPDLGTCGSRGNCREPSLCCGNQGQLPGCAVFHRDSHPH